MILRSFVLTLFLAASLQAQNTTISGVVKNSAGQPVDGAYVRVRSSELNLTFMVVSQAQGRYATPNLLPGKYTVEAIGGEYQSAPANPVEVRGHQLEKMDVQLTVARKVSPPRQRLTQAEQAARMPDAPAKQIILTKCVSCHTLDRAIDTRTLRIEANRSSPSRDPGPQRWGISRGHARVALAPCGPTSVGGVLAAVRRVQETAHVEGLAQPRAPERAFPGGPAEAKPKQ